MEPESTTKRRSQIGVIGDGALDPDGDEAKIRASRRLGELLIDAGHRVVCGGRGGVMAHVCRGARASTSYREGHTIGVLPGGDPDDANPFVDVVIPTSLGHARNGIVAHSDAVIAIGGGAGTLSEIAFAWIHNRLIIALRVAGWSGRLADAAVDGRQRFSDIDDDQVWGADSAAEAAELLGRHLQRYREA